MFKQLAEKNAKLYNDHPHIHAAILVGYFGIVVVCMPSVLKKIAGADTNP